MGRSVLTKRSVLMIVGLLAAATPAPAEAAGGNAFGHVATFRAAPGRYVRADGFAFSPDGTLLFAAGSVIDLRTWQWLGELTPASRGVDNRIVALGGDRLLVASDDGLGRWEMNPPRGTFRRTSLPTAATPDRPGRPHPFAKRLDLPAPLGKLVALRGGAPLVAVSPDAARLAVVERGDVVRVVVRDLATGAEVASCEAPDLMWSYAHFLAFSGDGPGQRLVFGNALKQFTWDIKAPFAEGMPAASSGESRLEWFALAPAVGRIVGGAGSRLVVWDAAGTKPPVVMSYRPEAGPMARCGALSADGLWCYFGHEEGVIRRLELSTGAVETVVTPAENRHVAVAALAVAPGGTRLAWTDNRGDAVHIVEAGGRPLPLGASHAYFPTEVGTQWVYKDLSDRGELRTRRRSTIVAREILGATRTVVVRDDWETTRDGQLVWQPLGSVWYAVAPPWVERVGNGWGRDPLVVQLRPIPEVPSPSVAGQGGRVEPEWVGRDGQRGSDDQTTWKVRLLDDGPVVLGVRRDAIEVERQAARKELESSRYAAGVGLYEVRTARGRTVLESFRRGPAADAVSAADPLPPGSVWDGDSRTGNWVFPARMTVVARAGDTFEADVRVVGAQGIPLNSRLSGRLIDGVSIRFVNRGPTPGQPTEEGTGTLRGDAFAGHWTASDRSFSGTFSFRRVP